MIANSIIIISNKVVKKGLYVRFMEVIKKLVKMHQSIHVIQCNDDVHILWKLQKSMKGKPIIGIPYLSSILQPFFRYY